MSDPVDVSSGQNGSHHFEGFAYSGPALVGWTEPVSGPEEHPIPELRNVRKRDEVCIVGYAPGRELAPFRDQNVDIWGMNDLWGQWTHTPALAPHLRWDAWFDPHKRDVMEKANRMKDEQVKWLQAQPASLPIFTLQRFEDIPGSRRLPYAEVCQQLGVKIPPYYTSTPAYMMAAAIVLGYKKVHIYGINLLGTGEYEYQRPCMEFWIGVAIGRGVEVVIPEESTLCKATFLYGYDTHGFPEALRVLELVKSKKLEAENGRIAAIAQQAKLEGQTEVINWINDMLRHAAYGGYIPPIKGMTPEAAQDQQKRDAGKRAMSILLDITERIKAGDVGAADRIPAAAAVAFGLPDSEVWR